MGGYDLDFRDSIPRKITVFLCANCPDPHKTNSWVHGKILVVRRPEREAQHFLP